MNLKKTMFRRTIPIILLTLICGGGASLSAQTPTSTPAADKNSVGTPNPAPSPAVKIPIPDPNAPLPVVNSNITERVGVDPSQSSPLTLNDAIRRALENNNDIEIARDDVRFNETSLRSLEGIYDPVFSLTPTFTRNTGARTSSGQQTNDFSLNLGFNQFLPRGGGRISPFFNNSRTGSFFNNTGFGSTTTAAQSVLSSGAFFSSSVGVQYVQPILRNRSIDNNRRQIRIQRKRLEQTDADFRLRTIETIAAVQRSYWDLVFALRDQQNRVENLNLTRENLRLVEAQISAGSAAPLARAEVATELANRESDLLLATQQVTTAENTLKQLLIRDSTSAAWMNQIIPTDEPNFSNTPVNVQEALADAKTNRPELKRLNLQNEINNIDRDFFRNQVKPQLDLVSSFSLNGFSQNIPGVTVSGTSVPLIAGDPNTNSNAFLLQQINALRTEINNLRVFPRPQLPPVTPPSVNVNNSSVGVNGGFGTTFGNLFNSSAPTYSVGVSVGFPFRNQSAKADLAGAEIQRTQIEAQVRRQEQIVVTEVRNAVQSVETARLRIATATQARQNAEIQLQGEQQLYGVGRSTTFLLFQRQNTLANARNAEIRSQTDYNKALAELQRATSTTLRANNVSLD